MPTMAAQTQPATMPATGPHSLNTLDPRKESAATTRSVTNAVEVASLGFASDAVSSRSNTTEARVMDSIIITVPPTMGVTIRRSMKSHLAITSWVAAVTRTSEERRMGPPSDTAAMQKGMENAAVNMGARARDPTGPIALAWMMVHTPTTNSDAKTIHMR